MALEDPYAEDGDEERIMEVRSMHEREAMSVCVYIQLTCIHFGPGSVVLFPSPHMCVPGANCLPTHVS